MGLPTKTERAIKSLSNASQTAVLFKTTFVQHERKKNSKCYKTALSSIQTGLVLFG